jgi:hypothetical protein
MPPSDTASSVTIPVIRMDDPDAARHIRRACELVGFFYREYSKVLWSAFLFSQV